MDKKEFMRQIREKRERLESGYEKGMLSSDDLVRQKTILFHDLTLMLSGEELEDVIPPEELFALCGLRKEDISGKTETVESDHNPLDDGGMYVFKDLTGLEHLITEKHPEGKQFTFRLPLTYVGKTIWKDYQFEVEFIKAGEDNWQGWTEYKGKGWFSIYAGEGTLLVRQEKEIISSVLYQKCYRVTSGETGDVI